MAATSPPTKTTTTGAIALLLTQTREIHAKIQHTDRQTDRDTDRQKQAQT